MSDVMSVARYVLSNTGYISTMKLQKLVYCSQVASLGATGRLLFPERIKAWANGPVAPRLFRAHRGRYVVDASDLDCASVRSLSQQEKALVDGVLDRFGGYTGAQLSARLMSIQCKSCRG